MPLSPRVPDLGALDMLLSVARLGSFGRVANEHQVTQQAISSRIKRMERLMGLSLVHRGTHGATLTPSGALLVDWAADVVGAATALEHGIDALRADDRISLKVAASMTVAEYLMPTWLVAARAEHLTASLRAGNSANVAEQVRTGRVDLGFVEGPSCPPGLEQEVVARDSLQIVVRNDHPWARRRSISSSELAATPLVQREPGSGTRSTLEYALSGAAIVVPALEVRSTTALIAAAENGTAPAVVSSLAAKDALRSGRLARVNVEELDLARTLRAIWPAGEALLGARRSFVALARRAPNGS